jgi:hypothetical protein
VSQSIGALLGDADLINSLGIRSRSARRPVAGVSERSS